MRAKDKKAEFERFREIYNAAWEKNWGFIPMNDAELQALIDDLGMLVEPKLAFFAEIADEPVGFALTIPNFNEALRRAYPRPGVPEIVTHGASRLALESPQVDPRRAHATDGRQEGVPQQGCGAGDAAGDYEGLAAFTV